MVPLVGAVQELEAVREEAVLKSEVCDDPDSVHVFHDAGLDDVSCSPFRVPVARLEAGRAAAGS